MIGFALSSNRSIAAHFLRNRVHGEIVLHRISVDHERINSLEPFQSCANDDKLVALFEFRSGVILVTDKCNCNYSKRSNQRMDEAVPGPEIGRGRKREGDI